MIITAYKLWDNGVFTGSCPMQFNCEELLGQPLRPAWLVLKGCCSPVNFQLTFQEPGASEYFLTGILVNYKGAAIVLDAASLDAVANACNQCCDPDPADVVVAGVYNGVLPPLPEPSPFELYMVVRQDNGTISAQDKAMRDYYGQYSAYFPFNRFSYEGGFSVYIFYADKVPFAIAPDIVAPFSADFISNEAPTLEVGEWYVFTLTYGGNETFLLKAETLDDIVAMANLLQPSYIDQGTFSVVGDQIQLIGVNYQEATLVITAETIPAPNLENSNIAPVLDPGEEFSFQAMLQIGIYDIGTLPVITAGTMGDLLTNIQADPVYALLGTWSLIDTDTRVQLSSSLITNGTMTITAVEVP